MSASNAISSSRKAPAAGPRGPRNAESSSSTGRRFALSGPTNRPDPRLNAWRSDIADVALAGQLFAPHYAAPLERACGMMATFVREGPSDGDRAVSQLLPGEGFAVLDITSGWAWGYCTADRRVGYVEAIELVEPGEATHVVVEAQAPIQAKDDPFLPPLSFLPMGSRLQGEVRGSVLCIESGCVPMSYVRAVGDHEEDAAAVALRLLGAPFAEGGRTLHGIDCSGLVQLALQLCGLEAPRDAAEQRGLGRPLAPGEPLKRGDLLLCGDHSGLMVDDRMAVQVSHSSEKVTVEPFSCAAPPNSGAGIERRRLPL